MKISGLLLATIISVTGVCSQSHAQQTYVKTVYKVTAQYAHPLNTFEGCNSYTYAGRTAKWMAESEALLNCDSDDNVTCSVVGTKYVRKTSAELPGYLLCLATVTVHGFSRQ